MYVLKPSLKGSASRHHAGGACEAGDLHSDAHTEEPTSQSRCPAASDRAQLPADILSTIAERDRCREGAGGRVRSSLLAYPSSILVMVSARLRRDRADRNRARLS